MLLLRHMQNERSQYGEGAPSSSSPAPGREQFHLQLLTSLKASGTGAEFGVVRRIATWIDSPWVLETIAGHPPWMDDWEVKEAFIRNENTPEAIRARCSQAVGVLDLLHELDHVELGARERAEVRDQARSLIQALPAEERKRVRRRALELSSSRDREVLAGEAEREPPRFAAEAAPASGAEEPAAARGPRPVAWSGKVGAGVLSRLPLDRRIALARVSRDLAVLQVLSAEPSETVQIALLANPALGDRLAANLARGASPAVAREIYRNRRLFNRPMVRRALLESPHLPSAAMVEVVSSMGDLRGLLGLTQNPKITSLEVKARARSRLTALFRGLGSAEKIETIRSEGHSLLKALWSDFFRDQELVLRCLRECHLDKGLVLEIASSSIAPRRALQLIGETPSLVASYDVRLALAKNPKTPPDVVRRIVPGLTAPDRHEIEVRLTWTAPPPPDPA